MEADPKELNDLTLDPSYAETLIMFEAELSKMLDPVETAKLARKYHGLITADGKGLIFKKASHPAVKLKK